MYNWARPQNKTDYETYYVRDKILLKNIIILYALNKYRQIPCRRFVSVSKEIECQPELPTQYEECTLYLIY